MGFLAGWPQLREAWENLQIVEGLRDFAVLLKGIRSTFMCSQIGICPRQNGTPKIGSHSMKC